MDLGSTPQPAGGSLALTVSPGAAGGLPTSADVAKMVAATSMNKRKRAGTHLIQIATTTAPAPAPPAAPAAASAPAHAKPKRVPRTKSQSGGGKALKLKRPAHRTGLPPVTPSPPPAESPAASPAPNPFEPMPQRYVKFSQVAIEGPRRCSKERVDEDDG
jgi:hypothetical protein